MSLLSGSLDTDIYILIFLDNESLFNWSQTCQQAYQIYRKRELWLSKLRFNLDSSFLKYLDRNNQSWRYIRQYYYSCQEITNKTVEESVIYAGSIGSIELVKWSIDRGAKRYNLAMKAAAKNGHLSVVALLIQNGANYWEWGLSSAIEGQFPMVIEFMIEQGACNWSRGFQIAQKSGNRLLANYFQKLM